MAIIGAFAGWLLMSAVLLVAQRKTGEERGAIMFIFCVIVGIIYYFNYLKWHLIEIAFATIGSVMIVNGIFMLSSKGNFIGGRDLRNAVLCSCHGPKRPPQLHRYRLSAFNFI